MVKVAFGDKAEAAKSQDTFERELAAMQATRVSVEILNSASLMGAQGWAWFKLGVPQNSVFMLYLSSGSGILGFFNMGTPPKHQLSVHVLSTRLAGMFDMQKYLACCASMIPAHSSRLWTTLLWSSTECHSIFFPLTSLLGEKSFF